MELETDRTDVIASPDPHRLRRVAAGTCARRPTARAAATDAERHETYKTFRVPTSTPAGSPPGTAESARNAWVRMTSKRGPDDRQRQPLANLGTVYYRLGDYTAAEVHYLRRWLIDGKLARR
ncbi:MAG: hypothetical protein H7A16_07185 [Sinobacteraceae bacterium]|nr:hypothetical protein [Nevskiaceae bacterium]